MKTLISILMLLILVGCSGDGHAKFSQSCPEGQHMASDGTGCVKDK